MDSIQGYDRNQSRVSESRASSVPSLRGSSDRSSTAEEHDKVSLTDLSAIGKKADASEPEIRRDAILRAQALLNDPDWLSDENLDALAEKLIEVEDI